MNVSFEQLKSMVVFSQVVEQGSLSGAAKHIGLSRAVVSYHLKKLEAHLQVKLLNRSTRSISLTEEGQAYYQSCKVIAEQAYSANKQIENMKSEPMGLIRMTCPVNAGLENIVPALNEFKRMYPKIELDVMLTDDIVNIINQGIDIAIRGAPLVDSTLQATKLSVLQTCLCGSPEYFNKHGRPKSPSDLSVHDWVIYKPLKKVLELKKGSRSFSIEMKGSISTNNASARTAFVEGGHGIGRIPTYDALPKIKQGTLESVLDDYQFSDINIYAVFPPGAADSKKIRLLLDFLKAYFDKKSVRMELNH
ncbi:MULTISPECIES: LysR family transcriptional regulator [Shewanella]|uniref:LysR family transcriptional regulator n=1 Tax=Shewanella electrodiphila TaxID=934143 RepID=A0ABT0KPY3_9GAMM|nr:MULTISPECIES: LysR family transcriptional regulator [unclassified Shewanella]MCC4832926.1 LysR family transcriptional regulator [Shewanella sp. 10N.7]MCL1045912.1 LysR family transcriptional regulator [Shewanella electrodiphila]PMG76630.1 transcriptional regulator [Shewanella sp. 10N.286.51.B7]